MVNFINQTISNLSNFYKKNNYDNIFKQLILTINLIVFLNFFQYVPIITPITILIYLTFSKISKKNKMKYIFVTIAFSIITGIGESIIVYRNPLTSLKYFNCDIFNLPFWLFSAYMNMILFVTILYDFSEVFITN